MSNEEKQLLFGEYASGNIAPADKRRLMAAALEDQDLFNSIAEQEELSELTATLPSDDAFERPQPIAAAYTSRAGAVPEVSAPAPLPPPRRSPWPFLFTGAAALALAVTGVFLLRTQTEPKSEVAQAPPAATRPAEPTPLDPAPPMPPRAAKRAAEVRSENEIVLPEAPAPPPVQDQLATAKSADQPKQEAAPAPVLVGAVAPLPYQLLRRGPTGELAPASELHDGDALVVRYVPTQPGPIDLQDLATNATLATRNATVGQSLDFPFTAVRGSMNLELRPRPPVALAFAETRNAAPAAAPAAASGGAARSEAAKERKAAPPPSGLRILLTVR